MRVYLEAKLQYSDAGAKRPRIPLDFTGQFPGQTGPGQTGRVLAARGKGDGKGERCKEPSSDDESLGRAVSDNPGISQGATLSGLPPRGDGNKKADRETVRFAKVVR